MKKKLFIKSDEVKFLACPQYEGLASQDILEMVGSNELCVQHLPDKRDIHKVPRQWIVNVAYTVMGAEFELWVEERIATRNKEIAKK